MKQTILKSMMAMLAALFSLSAYTYDVEFDGIYYNLDRTNMTASVTSGDSKYWGAVNIPEICTYNRKTYRVTSIGYYAFSGCSGLFAVNIPNSITSISSSAFFGCSGLTSIYVASTNKQYDSRKGCNAIIETTSNTLILGCKNTLIPNSVTSIGSGAFSGCSGLTSVTIPNSVTSIGNSAFQGCSGLTAVSIPNSVTSIGELAFSLCSNLTAVSIPNSITSIGGYAFSQCTSLTSVTIPNSVTFIGSGAFQGCTSLTSITIPNSVTTIGPSAFGGCGLTSLTIPQSVTSIDRTSFAHCENLFSITVDSENDRYDSRDNCNAIIQTASNKLIVGSNGTTIPNSVTSIGTHAFYGCNNMTSLTIPSSITDIGYYAFYNCIRLTSVVSQMESPVDFYAWNSSGENDDPVFYNISTSCTLTVPYGTKDAYIAAGWTENVFKGGIVEAEPVSPNITFADDNVKALCVANWDTNGDGELSEAEAAAVTDLGRVFNDKSITTFDELQYFTGLTSIGEGAFASCSLTSLKIPNGVTSIGGVAFNRCKGLTSVIIGTNVTSIDDYAFSSCCNLTSVIIPRSVTIIGEAVFSGCGSLSSIQVEDGNNIYDSRDNCNAIIETSNNTLIQGCKKTTIPNSVTTIGSGAFAWCRSEGTYSGLTAVNIPNSITSIGEWAFIDCYCLKSVVSEIKVPFAFGSRAFADISSSCTLTVPYGTKEAYIAAGWTENVFKGGIIEVPNPGVVSIGSAGIATFCCSRNLDFSGTKDVKAYVVSAFRPTTGEVTLTRIYEVPAGTGLVLIGKEGEYEIPLGTGEAMVSNLLVGINENTTLKATEGDRTNFILPEDQGDAAFCAVTDEVELPFGKAYLPLPTESVAHLEDGKLTLHLADPSLGDVDGDGYVNISDVTTLVNIILGK